MASMQEYEYPLPGEAIAQSPIEPRDAARLLVALGGTVEHRHVRDLADYVRPGDVIVVNETRVLPARLRLRKPSGGAAEVFLLERDPVTAVWEAMVRPSKKIAVGTRLEAGPDLTVEVGERLASGNRAVRLLGADLLQHPDEMAALAVYGSTPLPPYITAPLADAGRYQTVFARLPGSVAAPTAGLHITESVLDACRAAGAQLHVVDLAVGLDTFRPVTADRPEDHQIHSELYAVPSATMEACNAARAGGARVIAIGTTATRALESVAATGEFAGRTRLFIHGHYEFQVVDLMMTNFHLPRSSLLLMLDAFAGPRWRELYECALDNRYRFLSFGDAMLVDRIARRVR